MDVIACVCCGVSVGNIYSSPAGEGKARKGETQRQAQFPGGVVLPKGTLSSAGRTKPAESEVGVQRE